MTDPLTEPPFEADPDLLAALAQTEVAIPSDLEGKLAAVLAAAAEDPAQPAAADSLEAALGRDADEAWSLAVAVFGEPEPAEFEGSAAWEALVGCFVQLGQVSGLRQAETLRALRDSALKVAVRRGLEIAPAGVSAAERVELLLRGGLRIQDGLRAREGLRTREGSGGDLSRVLVEAYPESGSQELRLLVASEVLGTLSATEQARLGELREADPLLATLVTEHYQDVIEVPPRVFTRSDRLLKVVRARLMDPRTSGAGAEQPAEERAGAGARLIRASRRNGPVILVSMVAVLALTSAVGLIVWKDLEATRRGQELAAADEWAEFLAKTASQQRAAEDRLTAAKEVSKGDSAGALAALKDAERILRAFEEFEADFSVYSSRERVVEELRKQRAGLESIWRRLYLERARIQAASGSAGYPSALESIKTGVELHGVVSSLGGPLSPAADARRSLELEQLQLEEGRIRAVQGRHREALEVFAGVLADNPGSVEARIETGFVLHLQGNHREALSAYSAGIDRLSTQVPRPYLLRGQTRLALGLNAEALKDFSKVVELDDDSFEGFLWQGKAYHALGEGGEAVDCLMEAIDISPNLAEGYLERGRVYFDQQRLPQAAKDFEVAISRSATCYEAYLGLARTHEWLLEPAKAEQIYQQILAFSQPEARPVRARALAERGALSLVRSDPHAAAYEFDERIRRQGIRPSGRLGPLPSLARLQAKSQALSAERRTQARGDLDAAIQADPELVVARLARARLALQERKHAEARAQLQSLLGLLAQRPVSEKLGSGKSTEDDGWDDFEEAEDSGDHVLAEAWALLGLTDAAFGMESPAQEHFLQALKADKGCALAKAGQAHLVLQADPKQAREVFAKARELQQQARGTSGFFFEEGLRLKNLAQRSKKPEYYKRARFAFTQARTRNPLHALASYEEARLCAEWGAFDAAVACAEEAVAADPCFREGYELLGMLLARDLPTQRDAQTLRPGTVRDPLRAKEVFERALAVAATEDLAEAHYGRALALIALASVGERSLLQEARADLEAAVRLTPLDLKQPGDNLNRAQTYVRAQAQVYESLEDKLGEAKALARLDEIKTLSQEAARSELLAGRDFRDRLNYSAAIRRFDRAAELDPASYEAIYERGTCYLKIGNFVPGILDFSRALELNPRIVDEVYNKVYQICYVVDLNRVITELNKIVADHPKSYVVFLRGFFYVAKLEFKRVAREDIEAGIADFDRCLELNPKHVTALLYRGFLFSRLAKRLRAAAGQPVKGKQDEWALEEDPSTGRLTLPEEIYSRAMADYKRALELDPGSGISHYLQALYWSVRSVEADLTAPEAEARRRRALEKLADAFEAEFKGYERIRNEKGFAAIRGLPEFKKLMAGK